MFNSRMFLVMTLAVLALAACSAFPASEGVLQPTNPVGLDNPGSINPAAPGTQVPDEPPAPSTETPISAAAATIATTPEPTPTLMPVFRQLTTGGCCTQPFFAPDSQTILYLDRPAQEALPGLWQVDLQGGQPQFFTDRLGLFSADLAYLAYLEGELTIIERLGDGQRWTLSNGRHAVSFSPDNSLLAWTAGQPGPPYDSALRKVWISQIDGSQARSVVSLFSGGLVGWLPDGRLLLSGRIDASEEGEAYWVASLQDGGLRELTRASRLRGGSLSPDGAWLAYLVTFSPDPSENGLWLVQVETGQRVRLDRFGAYRWRDSNHLLVVPLDLGQPYHSLWEYEAGKELASPGQGRLLVDGRGANWKIANGDWTVSPDGRHVAYVSAEDHNIWLVELP